MPGMNAPPRLFEPKVRRIRQITDRGQDLARLEIFEEVEKRLLERLGDIVRKFEQILIVGNVTERFVCVLREWYGTAALVVMPTNNVASLSSEKNVCAGVEALPFADKSFDLVLVFLEHHAVQ